MYDPKRHVVLMCTLFLLCVGCTSSRPNMSVIGVRTPTFGNQQVKVFVEVHNPTSQSLRLQRLDYHLVADSWLNRKGRVEVNRMVGAGSSAIVELQVPTEGAFPSTSWKGAPYTLTGRLYATNDHVKHSWKLRAQGALTANNRSVPLRPGNPDASIGALAQAPSPGL